MNQNLFSHPGHRLFISMVAACVLLQPAVAQLAPPNPIAQGAPNAIDGRPDDWLLGSSLNLTYDPGFRVGYTLRTDGTHLFLLVHARVDVAQLRSMNVRAGFSSQPGNGTSATPQETEAGVQAVQVAPDGSVWYEGQFPVELAGSASPDSPVSLVLLVQALPNDVGLATALGLDQSAGVPAVNKPWFGTLTTVIPISLPAPAAIASGGTH